ncbi:44771_t:CDS:2 [Gigaspora margarita]|uniref:44771_t:CDS:1 n=1 Tax=Gigaspora margarita TaxID=4874 RepID=A0ABN7UQG0_GIGMA|nr:44771_t:CDS:2 [Gigaspora margarita]
MNKQQKYYNIGHCFKERTTSFHHISDTVYACSYCNAKLFLTETQEMCCKSVKIKLVSADDTIALKNLFIRNDCIGKDFRKNIRAYNNIFVFISMGVKLDENVANVQGGIYHSIGSLLPVDGIPKFLQLYIYDTEYETNNRLSIIPQLCHDTLELIKTLLDRLNPFNISFTAMSEDFAKHGIPNSNPRINAVLLYIKNILEQHYKSLNDYDLPSLTLPDNFSNGLPRLILNELNIIISLKI